MEPINARIETVESKPMFRDAFQTRRCIVPANGWYEWKTTPRGKVPFYHQSFDESVLSIAGIYDHWLSESGPLHTFSILTTEATEDVKHIHNRMPVLISKEDSDCWLEKKENMWPSSALSALLLLRLHAAGASQPPQPPPYTTAYPAEKNLWDVPPPPDMKVNLRPFRLATRGTVTAVFFCLAWRAPSQ